MINCRLFIPHNSQELQDTDGFSPIRPRQFDCVYLPAIVLRNMRYSKLDISRRCHFCVIFEFLISCLGDIMDARLKNDRTKKLLYGHHSTRGEQTARKGKQTFKPFGRKPVIITEIANNTN